jgi:predicted phosphodiesterase
MYLVSTKQQLTSFENNFNSLHNADYLVSTGDFASNSRHKRDANKMKQSTKMMAGNMMAGSQNHQASLFLSQMNNPPLNQQAAVQSLPNKSNKAAHHIKAHS